MKETLTGRVTDSIFEVMETMFYLTVEEDTRPVEDVSSLFDEKKLKACRITFSGKFSGAIYLLVGAKTLETMAAHFTGEDPDTMTDEHLDGALKEALNMIAGNALTKVDKQSYMGLGIPELVTPSDIGPSGARVAFNTSAGKMAAVISLEQI